MSVVKPPGLSDDLLLCYCTMLTFGELRRAYAAGCWPLPEKDRTGKLCTGCVGDLLHCLRQCGAEPGAPEGADA